MEAGEDRKVGAKEFPLRVGGETPKQGGRMSAQVRQYALEAHIAVLYHYPFGPTLGQR